MKADAKNIETGCACPACGGTAFSSLYRAVPSAVPGPFFVEVCASCGLGLTRPHPTEDELAILYPETYYRANAEQKAGLVTSLGRYLVGRVLRGRDDLVGKLPLGRILDVGCGNGEFLRRMADRGWETYGTDYSPAAVALASRFVKDVRQGSLEDAHFDDGQFDVVSMFHVLEHVPDPVATLGEIRRILAEGGRLVIEVPNRRSFGTRMFGTNWFALDVPRHLSHFTPSSLIRLLRMQGFAIELLRGATPLSNCYILFRSALLAATREQSGMVVFDPSFERAGLLQQVMTMARSVFFFAACAPVVLMESLLPRRAEAIRVVCRKVAAAEVQA